MEVNQLYSTISTPADIYHNITNNCNVKDNFFSPKRLSDLASSNIDNIGSKHENKDKTNNKVSNFKQQLIHKINVFE